MNRTAFQIHWSTESVAILTASVTSSLLANAFITLSARGVALTLPWLGPRLHQDLSRHALPRQVSFHSTHTISERFQPNTTLNDVNKQESNCRKSFCPDMAVQMLRCYVFTLSETRVTVCGIRMVAACKQPKYKLPSPIQIQKMYISHHLDSSNINSF